MNTELPDRQHEIVDRRPEVKITMRRDGNARITMRPRFDLDLRMLTALVALAEDEGQEIRSPSALRAWAELELTAHGTDRIDYVGDTVSEDDRQAAEQHVREIFLDTTWHRSPA
ncbi:hypothetical protein GCM10009789_83050 [Kribbella sancticallisti]|uniref:Uncharacterized protein n=1 Tax=Kribbella sancticallisti TaxID=460087 RepID=A0ABN2EVX3_9ACTN